MLERREKVTRGGTNSDGHLVERGGRVLHVSLSIAVSVCERRSGDVSAERRIRSLTALLTLELGNLAVGVVQSRVVPGHDQLLGAVQPGSRVGLGSKLGGCRRERKEKGQSRER